MKIYNHMAKLFFVVIFVTFYLTDSAQSQTVTWAIADRPTSYILRGKDKGRGAVDELYSLLQKHLKDYQHKNHEMSFARVLQQMKCGKNVCACGFKSGKREEVGLFSQPAIIAMPYSIVTKKEHLSQIFSNAHSISLEKLIKNKSITGGITQERSYGSITAVINENQNKNIDILANTSNLIKMLILDRVDYIIEIPSFAVYMVKQFQPQISLQSISIIENTNEILFARIFCTKNQWGKNIIRKIDKILDQEKGTPEYLELMERWYDENSRLIIRRYYNNGFVTSRR